MFGGVRVIGWAFAFLFIGCIAFFAQLKSAEAQTSSIFCPAGQTLINGFCVSPIFQQSPAQPCPHGYGPVSFGGSNLACVGFSSSEAGTQASVAAINSLTQQALSTTMDAIRERREEETQRCPDGSLRANNRDCQMLRGSQALGYADEDAYAADIRPGRMVLKAKPSTSSAASSVKTAVWFQVYGDHEHRNQTAAGGSLGGGTPVIPPGGLSLTADVSPTSNSFGILGGIDFTILNVTGNADALVIGALTGYASTRVTVPNNASTTDLSGPSVGVYAAYVKGNFSTDLSLKTDFFNQNTQFSDFSGGAFAVSGSQSVRLINYSTGLNVNYKIPLGGAWYVEPTAGLILSQSNYQNAGALGLSNGSATRLQGGARVGNDWKWMGMNVNSTLTGIAYDSVSVSGATVSGATTTTSTDEGKVFGQFLIASTVDLGRGLYALAAADVRFGNDLVGVGAKGGLRYQW